VFGTEGIKVIRNADAGACGSQKRNRVDLV
jgi:hypothetical protein